MEVRVNPACSKCRSATRATGLSVPFGIDHDASERGR
jgi:hypothetical protein